MKLTTYILLLLKLRVIRLTRPLSIRLHDVYKHNFTFTLTCAISYRDLKSWIVPILFFSAPTCPCGLRGLPS